MLSGFLRFEPENVRYQPDGAFKYANNPQYELDQRFLASLVGFVAIGLPFGLAIVGLGKTCFYDSISHFYYSQLWGDVFVAALIFIATFLVAYRGENFAESLLATIAGICAFFVAVFPTEGRGCEEAAFSGRALVDMIISSPSVPVAVMNASGVGEFFELFTRVGWVHFVSAALLFAFLAYYSLRVFTRAAPNQYEKGTKKLTWQKRRRNQIYVASGWTIIAAMAVMFANFVYEAFSGSQMHWWREYNATFFLEGLALLAFGISWVVKGRAFNSVLLDP